MSICSMNSHHDDYDDDASTDEIDRAQRRRVDMIMEYILVRAAKLNRLADLSGSDQDALNAEMLEVQVRFYKNGRDGQIPREWKKYEQEIDTEFAEYQRLRAKFEGR